MRVAGCGLNVKNPFLNYKEGDTEGAATKVEYEDILLLTLLVQPIGNCGSRGLVGNPQPLSPTIPPLSFLFKYNGTVPTVLFASLPK